MARSRNTADTQTASGGPVPPFVAGKNAIINGDFRIWQRGTTSTASAGRYLADRFHFYTSNSVTCQRSTDVPSGQGFTYSASVASGSGAMVVNQPYELPATGNAGVFGSGTWTISWWAKVASGTETILQEAYLADNVGGGNQVTLASSSKTVTTTWQRFSTTFTGSSANGTNTCIRFTLYSVSGISSTLTTTGWQVEAGPTATPFETATGTIQGELAACQRYYYRVPSFGTGTRLGSFNGSGTTNPGGIVQNPVQLRAPATSIEYLDIAFIIGDQTIYTVTNATLSGVTNPFTTLINLTTTASTAANAAGNLRLTSASGYLGVNAEL